MEDDRVDFEYEEAPIDAPPTRRGDYNPSRDADFQEEYDTRESAAYSRRPPPYGGMREARPRMYQPRPRGGFHASNSGRLDDRRGGGFVPRSVRPGEYRPRSFGSNQPWQSRSGDYSDDSRPIRYQYVDDLKSDRHPSSLGQESVERRPMQRNSRSRSPPRPIRSPVREYSPEPEAYPLEPPGFSEGPLARAPPEQHVVQAESHFAEGAPPSKDSQSSSRRFIVLKCLYYDIMAKAKYDCCWPTRRSTAERIADLQDAGYLIHLLFSLDNSQHFQGVGTLAATVNLESGPDPRYSLLHIKWICIADLPYGVINKAHPSIFGPNLMLRDSQVGCVIP